MKQTLDGDRRALTGLALQSEREGGAGVRQWLFRRSLPGCEEATRRRHKEGVGKDGHESPVSGVSGVAVHLARLGSRGSMS